jgi:hypothetical protein
MGRIGVMTGIGRMIKLNADPEFAEEAVLVQN